MIRKKTEKPNGVDQFEKLDSRNQFKFLYNKIQDKQEKFGKRGISIKENILEGEPEGEMKGIILKNSKEEERFIGLNGCDLFTGEMENGKINYESKIPPVYLEPHQQSEILRILREKLKTIEDSSLNMKTKKDLINALQKSKTPDYPKSLLEFAMKEQQKKEERAIALAQFIMNL